MTDPRRDTLSTTVKCRQCSAFVEAQRECYATPVCYACLPPPPPLPFAPLTESQLEALAREWRHDGERTLRRVLLAEVRALRAQVDVRGRALDATMAEWKRQAADARAQLATMTAERDRAVGAHDHALQEEATMRGVLKATMAERDALAALVEEVDHPDREAKS